MVVDHGLNLQLPRYFFIFFVIAESEIIFLKGAPILYHFAVCVG